MLRNLTLFIACTVLFCACNNNNKQTSVATSGNITNATLLSINKCEGYTQVKISDPWNNGKTLHEYILVPKSHDLPQSLPNGTIIRTPVEHALVYSSVHAQVIKELGKISSVTGVCDAEYFKIPEITAGLKKGTVCNAGSSMSPTIEKIVASNPEIIILSPFQNGGYGTIESLGIPILECADYMEDSPLGRAEWVKLFGLLFDEEQKSNDIFCDTRNKYLAIKDSLKKAKSHPKVLTETVNSGVWFVPGGNSYMARLILDAGGSYPWADNKDSGSLQLDFAQVLNKASDADIWLIKSSTIKTYGDLEKSYTLNSKFKAFKEKGVWVCDTQKTPLYEEMPFHPELLLKELATIFHPEIMGENNKLRYYTPL